MSGPGPFSGSGPRPPGHVAIVIGRGPYETMTLAQAFARRAAGGLHTVAPWQQEEMNKIVGDCAMLTDHLTKCRECLWTIAGSVKRREMAAAEGVVEAEEVGAHMQRAAAALEAAFSLGAPRLAYRAVVPDLAAFMAQMRDSEAQSRAPQPAAAPASASEERVAALEASIRGLQIQMLTTLALQRSDDPTVREQIAAIVASLPAPVVNVTNEVTHPVEVKVELPTRKTTSEITHDQDGYIVEVVQTERTVEE